MTVGSSSNGSDDGDEAVFSPEALREFFHRRTMAGEHHRATAARLLGMDDTAAAALLHLAQHGQLTPGKLGALIGLTSGGTTALIERLVKSGHLRRHPHPRDKRSSLITATHEVLERAETMYASLVQDLDRVAAERAVIGRYLSRVAEVSEHHAEHLADRSARRSTTSSPRPSPASGRETERGFPRIRQITLLPRQRVTDGI